MVRDGRVALGGNLDPHGRVARVREHRRRRAPGVGRPRQGAERETQRRADVRVAHRHRHAVALPVIDDGAARDGCRDVLETVDVDAGPREIVVAHLAGGGPAGRRVRESVVGGGNESQAAERELAARARRFVRQNPAGPGTDVFQRIELAGGIGQRARAVDVAEPDGLGLVAGLDHVFEHEIRIVGKARLDGPDRRAPLPAADPQAHRGRIGRRERLVDARAWTESPWVVRAAGGRAVRVEVQEAHLEGQCLADADRVVRPVFAMPGFGIAGRDAAD